MNFKTLSRSLALVAITGIVTQTLPAFTPALKKQWSEALATYDYVEVGAVLAQLKAGDVNDKQIATSLERSFKALLDSFERETGIAKKTLLEITDDHSTFLNATYVNPAANPAVAQLLLQYINELNNKNFSRLETRPVSPTTQKLIDNLKDLNASQRNSILPILTAQATKHLAS